LCLLAQVPVPLQARVCRLCELIPPCSVAPRSSRSKLRQSLLQIRSLLPRLKRRRQRLHQAYRRPLPCRAVRHRSSLLPRHRQVATCLRPLSERWCLHLPRPRRFLSRSNAWLFRVRLSRRQWQLRWRKIFLLCASIRRCWAVPRYLRLRQRHNHHRWPTNPACRRFIRPM